MDGSKNSKFLILLGLFFNLFAAKGFAQTEALYFKGSEKAPIGGVLGDCFLELTYSDDLSKVTVRAIAPHPHLSKPDQVVDLAMGPMVANYVEAKKMYRFQDTAKKAPVKDMVLNVTTQQNPTKYGAMIFHSNHHDPLFCESLSAVTEESELLDVQTLFETFEQIKAGN